MFTFLFKIILFYLLFTLVFRVIYFLLGLSAKAARSRHRDGYRQDTRNASFDHANAIDAEFKEIEK